MSLVGTLLFCTDCGDLLDRAAPKVQKVECQRCHTLNPNKWPPSSRTISKPDAFSSALRAKRGHVQALDHSHVETWATTSEACPVCNSSATLFRELQLRGADEGSTVFFRCSNCAHKYVSATLPKQHRGFEFADDFQVEIEQLSKSNDVRGWVPATPTYHSTAVRGTE